MNKKSLQQQWQEICNDYLREFCHRHDYTYDPQYWIGSPEGIGTIAWIGDTMLVDMEDLRYDVDNQVPVDKFEKWYWKQLELNELGIEVWLNYRSYCLGAPDEWTDERMQKLREVHDCL